MTSALLNSRALDAWCRRPVDRTPIWLMRQAGRYQPEYRAIRERHGFVEMCKTPDLAARIALAPIEQFGFDAAILFSDLLFPLEAMGVGLTYEEGEGPVLDPPVRTAADVDRLAVPDPTLGTRFVLDAVRATKAALADRVPLLGFAGAPWTLATYLVEGRTSKSLHAIQSLRYSDPGLLHRLLDKIARTVAAYLDAQIEAGADAVQIFDTWAEVLSPADYAEFAYPYTRQVIEGLRSPRGPVVLFCRGGNAFLDWMVETGADCLSLDWRASLSEARMRVGHRVALQGNLAPSALAAPPARIREEARRVLEDFGPGSGHVFNIGHGVLPDIPPDHVRALVESVAALSPVFHGRVRREP